MESGATISKVGFYSLPIQCILLCAALPAIAFKLGAPAAWLFIASALAGIVAFACGIFASVVLRNPRWLALSAAAAFVLLFSLLLGISLGGHPGV